MFASDREHVEQVLAGETEAFENLVRKYNRLGGAIAYGVLGDFQLAEDVVQEAFFKAYRALGSLRRPDRFRVWFAGIVKKCAIDELRRRKSGPGAAISLEARAEGPAGQQPLAAKESASPVGRFLREERRQKILEALAELPEEDRLVVVLKHMEGLSYKEIAEISMTTVSSVESRLFRARQTLRKKITQLLNSDP
jgi:RNA polymerase sigma-70 factor (ECF subfamily)